MKTSFILSILLLSPWVARSATGETNHLALTNAVRLTPALINRFAEEMRARHPALKAAEARWSAAKEAVRGVRVWDDPMVRLGTMAAETEMRAEDGDLIYGAEQKVPVFGKPTRARQVAEAEANREQAQVDYQFQLLRRDLAKNFFSAALAQRTVEVGQEDLAWLEQMAASLDQRYRAGEASQVWLLRVQNDRARRLLQLETDRQKLLHEHAILNRMLSRELTVPWPALLLPSPAAAVAFNKRLVDFALANEPRLRVLHREVRMGQANVEWTRRQRWPDVSVGVEGRNYSRSGDFRSAEFMVALTVPLGNRSKYRSDLLREQARLGAIQAERADYEWSIREEVHLLTTRIDAARREAVLYRDEVLPRAQLALTSAQSAWMANRVMFLDVLEARRMWLEGHLMYARAVAEQYQMLSELVLCCGLGDLEALAVIGALPASQTAPQP